MQCIYMFWRQLVCRSRKAFIQKQHSGNYCAQTPNQETLFLLKWITKWKAYRCDGHITKRGECCFELRGRQMKDPWLLELIMSLSAVWVDLCWVHRDLLQCHLTFIYMEGRSGHQCSQLKNNIQCHWVESTMVFI